MFRTFSFLSLWWIEQGRYFLHSRVRLRWWEATWKLRISAKEWIYFPQLLSLLNIQTLQVFSYFIFLLLNLSLLLILHLLRQLQRLLPDFFVLLLLADQKLWEHFLLIHWQQIVFSNPNVFTFHQKHILKVIYYKFAFHPHQFNCLHKF